MPVGDLAEDAERLAGAVGAGGIAGEFFVGEIGVVHDGAGWLDEVDSAGAVAECELCSPGGCVQGGGEIDVVRLLPLAVVGGVAGGDQVSRFQVGAGAVVELLRLLIVRGCRGLSCSPLGLCICQRCLLAAGCGVGCVRMPPVR